MLRNIALFVLAILLALALMGALVDPAPPVPFPP
jgi:hypothetical protein